MDNSIVQHKYVTNIAWAMFIQKYNECLLELNFTDCPIFSFAKAGNPSVKLFSVQYQEGFVCPKRLSQGFVPDQEFYSLHIVVCSVKSWRQISRPSQPPVTVLHNSFLGKKQEGTLLACYILLGHIQSHKILPQKVIPTKM